MVFHLRLPEAYQLSSTALGSKNASPPGSSVVASSFCFSLHTDKLNGKSLFLCQKLSEWFYRNSCIWIKGFYLLSCLNLWLPLAILEKHPLTSSTFKCSKNILIIHQSHSKWRRGHRLHDFSRPKPEGVSVDVFRTRFGTPFLHLRKDRMSDVKQLCFWNIGDTTNVYIWPWGCHGCGCV